MPKLGLIKLEVGTLKGGFFCVFVWCEAIERGQFIGNLLQVEWPR